MNLRRFVGKIRSNCAGSESFDEVFKSLPVSYFSLVRGRRPASIIHWARARMPPTAVAATKSPSRKQPARTGKRSSYESEQNATGASKRRDRVVDFEPEEDAPLCTTAIAALGHAWHVSWCQKKSIPHRRPSARLRR